MTMLGNGPTTATYTTILAEITCLIGGVIYTRTPAAQQEAEGKCVPVVGATVAIKDQGRFTQTDEQGRFRFSRLKPGEYTLEVTTAEGQQSVRHIQVPPSYNIEIIREPARKTAPTKAAEPEKHAAAIPPPQAAPTSAATTKSPGSRRTKSKGTDG